MNTGNHSQKQGFVMVSVMIIAMILVVLAGGAMTRGRLLAASAVRLSVDSQNEWNAQSGLEEAVARFIEEDFGDFTAGSGAIVTVTPGASTDVYQVTSVMQSHSGRTDTLTQTFKVEWNLGETNMCDLTIGLSTNLTDIVLFLNKNNAFIGLDDSNSVYVVGSIDGGENLTIDVGTFEITGTSTVANASITTNADYRPLVEKVIEAVLDKMDGYDTVIAAGGSSISSGTTITLNGGTVVLNGGGNVTLSENTTVRGTGTLIVQGNLVIGNYTELILGDGVSLLIEGNLCARNAMTMTGDESILYVAGTAELKNTADLSGSILVGGDLISQNSANFNGLVFVNGMLTAENNVDTTGVFMAGAVDMFNNTDFNLTRAGIKDWFKVIIDQLVANEVGTKTTPKSVRRTGWQHATAYN
jgi:hypothetical protein